jgi:hypothetical protein
MSWLLRRPTRAAPHPDVDGVPDDGLLRLVAEAVDEIEAGYSRVGHGHRQEPIPLIGAAGEPLELGALLQGVARG